MLRRKRETAEIKPKREIYCEMYSEIDRHEILTVMFSGLPYRFP